MRRKMLQPAPLTSYELASLLLSAIALVSLFFISEQVRMSKIQSKASNTQTVTGPFLEIDKLFIADPELRPYFYDGQEISEDAPNYQKVLAVAEFQLDVFDTFFTQEDYVTLDTEERQNWVKYMGDSFHTSPALCRRLNPAQDWYTAKLVKLAKSNCPKDTLQ